MQKLIEGAKMVKEFIKGDDAIIGVRFIKNLNTDTMKYRTVADVHVREDIFKELVEDFNIQPCYVEVTERGGKFPIELEVCIEGIYFTTLLTEHEYEAKFREWIYEEPNIDEEFLVGETSPMPENERKMREAGHKLHDFA